MPPPRKRYVAKLYEEVKQLSGVLTRGHMQFSKFLSGDVVGASASEMQDMRVMVDEFNTSMKETKAKLNNMRVIVEKMDKDGEKKKKEEKGKEEPAPSAPAASSASLPASVKEEKGKKDEKQKKKNKDKKDEKDKKKDKRDKKGATPPAVRIKSKTSK